MKLRSKARRQLVRDLFFIFVGAVIALLLAQSGLIDSAIDLLGNVPAASFVAGIFFTSAFTIAPSAVALAHVAQSGDIWSIVIWGALGAMCGDLLLFFFIRDRFADDLLKSFKPSFSKHILASFHLGFMKWLAPVIGAFIIASPLPDEFGLMLMGMSKTHIAILMPVSFLMNALGIYAIVLFGKVI